MQKKISLFAGITLLLVCCKQQKQAGVDTLPFYNSPDFTPVWMKDMKQSDRDQLHTISDFSFTDQDGKTITQKIVEGKIHIADFFFTTCAGICPKMNNNFEVLQDTFMHDADILLLSFSVTPWIDSVTQLKMYADMHNVATGKWHLLTGDKKEIYDLARKSYFAEDAIGFNKDTSEFLHTEHFILVDKQQHIRGVYNGTLQLETDRLIKDIILLKKEK